MNFLYVQMTFLHICQPKMRILLMYSTEFVGRDPVRSSTLEITSGIRRQSREEKMMLPHHNSGSLNSKLYIQLRSLEPDAGWILISDLLSVKLLVYLDI